MKKIWQVTFRCLTLSRWILIWLSVIFHSTLKCHSWILFAFVVFVTWFLFLPSFVMPDLTSLSDMSQSPLEDPLFCEQSLDQNLRENQYEGKGTHQDYDRTAKLFSPVIAKVLPWISKTGPMYCLSHFSPEGLAVFDFISCVVMHNLINCIKILLYGCHSLLASRKAKEMCKTLSETCITRVFLQ